MIIIFWSVIDSCLNHEHQFHNIINRDIGRQTVTLKEHKTYMYVTNLRDKYHLETGSTASTRDGPHIQPAEYPVPGNRFCPLSGFFAAGYRSIRQLKCFYPAGDGAGYPGGGRRPCLHVFVIWRPTPAVFFLFKQLCL